MPRANAVVRTVDRSDFARLCRDLADQVSSFAPDLVVGIRTGGLPVAQALQLHLPGRPEVVALKIQRPGTRVKEAVRLGSVLPKLPQPVLDSLRILEVEYREARHRLRLRATRGPAERALPVGGIEELRAAAPSAQRILIVDDTVDSGLTLLAAIDAVRSISPTARIQSAVIASTWRRPPVVPDYCLHNRLLLRMPWSHDASEGQRRW